MSGGVVYQHVLRHVARLALPEVARRDVLAALEAAQPGPLPLLYAAGQSAGLAREVLLERAAGIFFSFAAGNLADDLSDGDCTYYEAPERVAPYVQFLLQNLAWSTLAGAGLPSTTLSSAARALATGAGPQGLEVRTRQWTVPLYKEVAEGLAGRQWEAYLRLLYADTPEEARAAEAGFRLGVATMTADDCATGDTRFHTLPPEGQQEVRAWALALARPLEDSPLPWLARALPPVLTALAAPEPCRAEAAHDDEESTRHLLRRYGPGPRVHLHTGLVHQPPPPGADARALQHALVEAQEALLAHGASTLTSRGHVPGRLLEVGCGLGGGALWWATTHGAQVTAISPMPSHVACTERFAREAGLSAQVSAVQCDPLAVPGEGCFDTVVAVESACRLPRAEWMRRVHALLRPGGRLLVVDWHLGRPELRVPFDAHWHTRIGTRAEDVAAAQQAGLVVEAVEDLGPRAADFWALSLRLLETERARQVGPFRQRWRTERREHKRLKTALADGGLCYGLLVARR